MRQASAELSTAMVDLRSLSDDLRHLDDRVFNLALLSGMTFALSIASLVAALVS